MAWYNRKPPVNQSSLALLPGYREVSTSELVSDFEILEANGDYIVVTAAETPQQRPFESIKLAAPSYGEVGFTGPSSYSSVLREEYNNDLREKNGLIKYDRMRRSDASVRSALRLIKTPVLSARWFIQPYSEDPQDVEIALHVHRCLFHYMTISWAQVLWEALLMMDFGHYMFEKVYAEYEGKIIWQKLAPRHPLDVEEWYWDENGGPTGVGFAGPVGQSEPVFIPIEKLAVFSFDREAGDLRGISALRSAYQHWYYKENLYKIDAIQKERHGVGVPIIKLPPGYTDTDRNVAHELGRNLRSNEKAHVVLPPFWEVMFAKLEGQHVDALESASHHSDMIFQNILAEFMTSTGSSDDARMEMFLKSTRYVAEIVRDVFNKYCIPQLVDMNWDVEPATYPELRVRRIGDTQDWRMISFALRNLIGAQVIKPDDRLDEWAREEMDLPRADPSSVREVAAPQNPGAARVGMPRQSTAGNQRQQPGTAAGRDSSGQGTTGVH